VTSLLDHQLRLNRLTEAAVYITGADEGSLLLREPPSKEVRLRAHQARHEPHARPENRIVQDRLAAHVLSSGAPLVLPDANAPVDWAESGGTTADRPQALIAVPISTQGEAVGVLRVARYRPGTFSPNDLSALAALASYAALAIENADLRTEIQDKMERMAICEIGASFGTTLRLDTVLEMVMQVAVRIIDAERGYIVLRDQESGAYLPRQVYPPDTAPPSGRPLPFGGDIVRNVLQTGEPILATAYVESQAGDQDELRAVMCMPIRNMSGIVGAIYVDHSDYTTYFDDYHQDILGTLSANAAAAVENARLFSQVEAERRKLEAVIRGTDQPVIVTDVDGTVLLMNAAAHRAFSTRRRRATGMLLLQISDHPALAQLYTQARLSGQVQHGEIALHGERTYSATVTPVADVGFVTVMQDITVLKQLSQIKSEFVATVSHDLRSPLSAVLGFLDVLDQAGPLTEKQRSFVESAQREVWHLIELTAQLLDLGRLEADVDLPMSPCELRELVGKTIEHWQHQVLDGKHSLIVRLPRRVLWVRGNAGRLRQVIDNLVNNAVKYSPDGGVVSVELRREGQEAVLRVQDSGIGIPPEHLPYIFDRFYRVRSLRAEGIEGSGLGLAIVKSIVERHHGRVWVESEPGEGSTFGVALPTIEVDEKTAHP